LGHLLLLSCTIEVMFVRKTTNKAGNIAVQVVKKVNRKNKVLKHLGTAKTSLELAHLVKIGQEYINHQRINSGIVSFFDSRFQKSDLEKLFSKLSFTQSFETATYQFLEHFYRVIGFNKLNDHCFQDLVIARIIKPCSKRQTREFLELRFGKKYSLTKIYRTLRTAFDKQYQGQVEQIVYQFVTHRVNPTITVVFFDVTTLYYEASDEDEIRKCGFSKDHKHNQPQVMVAITVTIQGIPLAMKMFPGNTFEGHTLLPCLQETVNRFRLNDCVVVADSAMLNQNNLALLEKHRLKYIVGARLGNLSQKLFREVIKIPRVDKTAIRVSLNKERFLVVSYSAKRAVKDKHDREKQIKKARESLAQPGKLNRRYKFIRSAKKGFYCLNQSLIKKVEQLEGLKGYISNAAKLKDEEVIGKYAELWQVEKAFRMSKSDLKARPIFHAIKQSIEAHLLIVFTALVIARYVELTTNQSISRVVKTLNQVKEIIVEDPSSKQIVSKFTKLNSESRKLLKLAKLNWVT